MRDRRLNRVHQLSMPAFRLDGRMLIWFGAAKHHCALIQAPLLHLQPFVHCGSVALIHQAFWYRGDEAFINRSNMRWLAMNLPAASWAVESNQKPSVLGLSVSAMIFAST